MIKRRSKYGAKKTIYNGQKYDSKKEANFAKTLDLLRKAKGVDRVLSWRRQITFSLDINDIHICKYILDFQVEFEGRTEYVDVKGYRKGDAEYRFKLKSRMMKAIHGIDIKIV